MYVCILGKFRDLGVDMLPRIEEVQESSDTLRALTEGVHSREALDMVKEHVLGVLGPASMAYAATKIKMSALQAAQVCLSGGWCGAYPDFNVTFWGCKAQALACEGGAAAQAPNDHQTHPAMTGLRCLGALWVLLAEGGHPLPAGQVAGHAAGEPGGSCGQA